MSCPQILSLLESLWLCCVELCSGAPLLLPSSVYPCWSSWLLWISRSLFLPPGASKRVVFRSCLFPAHTLLRESITFIPTQKHFQEVRSACTAPNPTAPPFPGFPELQLPVFGSRPWASAFLLWSSLALTPTTFFSWLQGSSHPHAGLKESFWACFVVLEEWDVLGGNLSFLPSVHSPREASLVLQGCSFSLIITKMPTQTGMGFVCLSQSS